jgi:Gluconate 2-dehydrogenase subunit 3
MTRSDWFLKSAAAWSNVTVMREPTSNAAHPITFSRRAALKTLGAGLGAVAVWPYVSDQAAEAFALIQETKAPPALKFLTPAQYATVDRFVEVLIPADEHSPGASDARVADYIDLLLSESDAQTQGEWTTGVAALDEESRRRFQSAFDRLAPAQATTLVTEISRSEQAASTILERFFAMTKDAAIRGYYTSEIGIHKELTYKGNKFLREFVGCTHPEHGYSGD